MDGGRRVLSSAALSRSRGGSGQSRLESERSTQALLGSPGTCARTCVSPPKGIIRSLEICWCSTIGPRRRATNIGEGSASGMDLLLDKRMSRGWSAAATYSYSRARRGDRLGEGDYASDSDRPHSWGIVAAWSPATDGPSRRNGTMRPAGRLMPSSVHSDVLGDAGPALLQGNHRYECRAAVGVSFADLARGLSSPLRPGEHGR